MEPSSQLQTELQSAVHRSLESRRPLLHHLNADTSWLLQLPRPSFRRGSTTSASSDNRSSPSYESTTFKRRIRHKRSAQTLPPTRAFYNILIDPWLRGGQSDVTRWLSQQWHVEQSAVQTIVEVEELAKEIEALAGAQSSEENEAESMIDCVVISHEFTDHCHKETLLEVDANVPVFASEKAAELISSWNHFRQVIPQTNFSKANSDWRLASVPPLPDWISITRLVSESNALYYHSAVLIAFSIPDSDQAEGVVYTPHGLHAPSLNPLLCASPPIRPLALLHGLHDVRIAPSFQLNLGGVNAAEVIRSMRPTYWVATHDEVKRGGGLVAWFLRRTVWKVSDIFNQDPELTGSDTSKHDEVALKQQWQDALSQTQFLDVGNGVSCTLE